MKRLGLLALVIALLLPGVAGAAGNCTSVNVGTSSTQVLAANDLGSPGRHQLCITNTTVSAAAAAVYAYCQIGGTAALNQGIQLLSAFVGTATVAGVAAQPFCFPPVQLSARTWPIVPSGQLNCIGSAATTNITACDW